MAIAELLPDRGLAPLELAPSIELPSVDVVPESVRPAIRRYAVERSAPARAALVGAVDQVGHGWEHAIASRALEARAELVDTCRRTVELHDELVRLHAAERWLRAFPWRCSWDPEPYTLHVAGHLVAVPELLGAIEDQVDVDVRLAVIGRRRVRRDPPYELPVRRGRPGSGPAQIALAEAGGRLSEVAEIAGVSVSAVSRWLVGSRPHPDELATALEQLLGADAAAEILSLIPATPATP